MRVHDNQGLQDEVHIKFDVDAQDRLQALVAQTTASYVADTGAAYSDTRGYGWVRQDSLSQPDAHPAGSVHQHHR